MNLLLRSMAARLARKSLVVEDDANQDSPEARPRPTTSTSRRSTISSSHQEIHTERRLGYLCVGFCMGGAILAEALALGCVTADDLDCVVLMTLGLFYETSIDGRLKSRIGCSNGS